MEVLDNVRAEFSLTALVKSRPVVILADTRPGAPEIMFGIEHMGLPVGQSVERGGNSSDRRNYFDAANFVSQLKFTPVIRRLGPRGVTGRIVCYEISQLRPERRWCWRFVTRTLRCALRKVSNGDSTDNQTPSNTREGSGHGPYTEGKAPALGCPRSPRRQCPL